MPFILYPDVPMYPGVPPLVRPPGAFIAEDPIIAIGIGTLENILINLFQDAPTWGIFTAAGLPLGQLGTSTVDVITAITVQPAGRTSTYSFDFARETRISDFPLEKGSFASYNKVRVSANPTVTVTVEGDESERRSFLNILDAATLSTDLFSIRTPEVQYVDYAIERYSLQRAADKGATLLMIDITLKEIRQVAVSLVTIATPIAAPQDPGATPPVNNGQVQPDTSTLRKGVDSIKNKMGIN